MRNRIIVFSVIAVLWCGFIFYLSSENSGQSSQRSSRVITKICEIVDSDFPTYPEAKKAEIVNKYSFSVRKLAHFTAYAILGALFFQVFCFVRKKKFRALFSIAASSLYALSDEIHQSFSPGRSCEFRDVLIDTSGAALAVAISLLILYLHQRKRQRTVS